MKLTIASPENEILVEQPSRNDEVKSPEKIEKPKVQSRQSTSILKRCGRFLDMETFLIIGIIGSALASVLF